MRIYDGNVWKCGRSKFYNFDFNKQTGFFRRWGKTKEDDPQWSPLGPEILDLEISSGGDCMGNCPFCYKCNGGDQPTHNMTFEEFKIIFDKMTQVPLLTQIAFGIMNINTNPDFFKMMSHARENGVAPNYTCHGLDVTPEVAKFTAKTCGAVAVSLVSKEKTYNAIKMFTDEGMEQVNIHFMLSKQTYGNAFKVVDDIASDPRLTKFNAIIFLQYKSKGRNPDAFDSIIDPAEYKKLTDYCDEKRVRYGFDSCSAPIYLDSIKDHPKRDLLSTFVEPCESGLFSSYINCHGQFFVCSFAEGEDMWIEGIDVLGCDNFLMDVWQHPRLQEWRQLLLGNRRECPIYDLSYTKQV